MPHENEFADGEKEGAMSADERKPLNRLVLCQSTDADGELARPLLAIAWEVWNA